MVGKKHHVHTGRTHFVCQAHKVKQYVPNVGYGEYEKMYCHKVHKKGAVHHKAGARKRFTKSKFFDIM